MVLIKKKKKTVTHTGKVKTIPTARDFELSCVWSIEQVLFCLWL